MDKSADNYDKVLDLLKRSRPQHKHPDILEEKIMESIRIQGAVKFESQSVPGFLFGWTRIVWVRRALTAAAAVLILFLAYQQSVILRQISNLNQQLVPANLGNPSSGTARSMELLLFRLSAGRDGDISKGINEAAVDEFIESVDMINEKYRELLKLIDEDPELKKLIEKKLEEKIEKELPEKTKL